MATNNSFGTRQACSYFFKVVLDAQDEPTAYVRCQCTVAPPPTRSILHQCFLLLWRRRQRRDPRASCRVTYLDPASSSGPPQPTVRKSPAKQPRKPQRPEAKGKRRRSSRVKSSSDGEELLKPPVMTQTPMK
ncbi:hypothetical protein PI124_g10860 [Phytophthora idaei]|nr:hypothetical protein PI124_g10860 [Phytophthora idaei]